MSAPNPAATVPFETLDKDQMKTVRIIYYLRETRLTNLKFVLSVPRFSSFL